MRTTLAIDDDIMATAKYLAQREHKSVGAVISAMARRGIERERLASSNQRNGVPLLPLRPGASPVTPELVNQLSNELA